MKRSIFRNVILSAVSPFALRMGRRSRSTPIAICEPEEMVAKRRQEISGPAADKKVGVLRLRGRFASRSGHSAQDDRAMLHLCTGNKNLLHGESDRQDSPAVILSPCARLCKRHCPKRGPDCASTAFMPGGSNPIGARYFFSASWLCPTLASGNILACRSSHVPASRKNQRQVYELQLVHRTKLLPVSRL